MHKYLAAALMLFSAHAHAVTYGTSAPGTIVGNPYLYAAPQIPLAAASYGAAQLAVLKAANMQVTTDQAMSMMALPGKYLVTAVYATNCSASPAGALGGIYTAASKGGTAVVASTQAYTGLTTTTALSALTVAVTTATVTATQLYFSLSAALGSAATCDLYVYGVGLQ